MDKDIEGKVTPESFVETIIEAEDILIEKIKGYE